MFSRILNIGVYPDLDIYQKREARILNLISIIVVFGLLLGATNLIFLGEIYPFLFQTFLLICTLFIPLLNKHRQYNASAFLFVIYINAAIVFINNYYNPSTATYLYYFPVVICTALLHNPKKPVTRTLYLFLIILVSFIISRFVKIRLIVPAPTSPEQDQILFNYNIYFCIFITFIMLYLLIRLINQQYREQADLIEKAGKDAEIIESSLRDKEVLLSEIQHRVKNNMAVIIGLLNMQRESSENEGTKKELIEAKNRVLSIAMVHERLYKKSNLSHILLKSYISNLAKEIIAGHPLHSHVKLELDIEEMEADITKAVPVGLIVNEAITNSLKHAFEGRKEKDNRIHISVARQFDTIRIKIRDNGVGFSAGKQKNERSLGLTLIESLSEQLDGKVEFIAENGALVNLVFPL